MKIVAFGNCTNLRKYVDEMVLKNYMAGPNNISIYRTKKYAYSLIKFMLVHKCYSLTQTDGKESSLLFKTINIIMDDINKTQFRKEKVKRIQQNLKNAG